MAEVQGAQGEQRKAKFNKNDVLRRLGDEHFSEEEIRAIQRVSFQDVQKLAEPLRTKYLDILRALNAEAQFAEVLRGGDNVPQKPGTEEAPPAKPADTVTMGPDATDPALRKLSTGSGERALFDARTAGKDARPTPEHGTSESAGILLNAFLRRPKKKL